MTTLAILLSDEKTDLIHGIAAYLYLDFYEKETDKSVINKTFNQLNF